MKTTVITSHSKTVEFVDNLVDPLKSSILKASEGTLVSVTLMAASPLEQFDAIEKLADDPLLPVNVGMFDFIGASEGTICGASLCIGLSASVTKFSQQKNIPINGKPRSKSKRLFDKSARVNGDDGL